MLCLAGEASKSIPDKKQCCPKIWSDRLTCVCNVSKTSHYFPTRHMHITEWTPNDMIQHFKQLNNKEKMIREQILQLQRAVVVKQMSQSVEIH